MSARWDLFHSPNNTRNSRHFATITRVIDNGIRTRPTSPYMRRRSSSMTDCVAMHRRTGICINWVSCTRQIGQRGIRDGDLDHSVNRAVRDRAEPPGVADGEVDAELHIERRSVCVEHLDAQLLGENLDHGVLRNQPELDDNFAEATAVRRLMRERIVELRLDEQSRASRADCRAIDPSDAAVCGARPGVRVPRQSPPFRRGSWSCRPGVRAEFGGIFGLGATASHRTLLVIPDRLLK